MTHRSPKRSAFTLIELLVVISIIALLISILLPALNAARASAKDTQCLSRMRQVGVALTAFSVDNKEQFPYNESANRWYYKRQLGGYLPDEAGVLTPAGEFEGGVLACPSDEGSSRSYVPNNWSTPEDGAHFASGGPVLDTGTPFDAAVINPAQMMLVGETWAKWVGTLGWKAGYGFGIKGATPGERFTNLTSPPFNPGAGPYGGLTLPNDINWTLHGSNDDPEVAAGSTRFTYVDGHVESKQHTDLVDGAGVSTLDTWWSPKDSELVAGP